MSARLVVQTLLGVALMLSAGVAAADPNCRCRYDGRYFSLGDKVCIKVNGRTKMARCDMFLNNTSWTFLGDSCPLSENAPYSHFDPVQIALKPEAAATAR